MYLLVCILVPSRYAVVQYPEASTHPSAASFGYAPCSCATCAPCQQMPILQQAHSGLVMTVPTQPATHVQCTAVPVYSSSAIETRADNSSSDPIPRASTTEGNLYNVLHITLCQH